MTAPKPSVAYGTCRACGRVLGLRKDATMRKHDGPAGTAKCPGSRQMPRWDRPVMLATFGIPG